jgi:Tol biopolymer transport system component
MRSVILFLLVAGTVAAAAGSQTVAELRPTGRIAFSAGPLEPGHSNIYVVNADGNGLHQLTHAGINFDPSLSPDGKKVVFRGIRNGNEDVYAVDGDGTHQRRLTNYAEIEYSPAWSPDGSKIAFASTRGGLPHIWVMDADGGRQRRIGRTTGEYPAWSPNGKRIAFAINPRVTQGGFEIAVMRSDGSHYRRLTRNASSDMGPAWSPSGKTIAFQSSRGRREGYTDLYVMRPDGSHVRRLRRDVSMPAWSPHGRFLVAATGGDLAILTRNGRLVRRLRLGLPEPNFASWSRAG